MCAGVKEDQLSLSEAVKAVSGSLVGFFKGMNIDIGCVNGGMPQSFGNCFDISSVRKKQRCAGMS